MAMREVRAASLPVLRHFEVAGLHPRISEAPTEISGQLSSAGDASVEVHKYFVRISTEFGRRKKILIKVIHEESEIFRSDREI